MLLCIWPWSLSKSITTYFHATSVLSHLSPPDSNDFSLSPIKSYYVVSTGQQYCRSQQGYPSHTDVIIWRCSMFSTTQCGTKFHSTWRLQSRYCATLLQSTVYIAAILFVWLVDCVKMAKMASDHGQMHRYFWSHMSHGYSFLPRDAYA